MTTLIRPATADDTAALQQLAATHGITADTAPATDRLAVVAVDADTQTPLGFLVAQYDVAARTADIVALAASDAQTRDDLQENATAALVNMDCYLPGTAPPDQAAPLPVATETAAETTPADWVDHSISDDFAAHTTPDAA